MRIPRRADYTDLSVPGSLRQPRTAWPNPFGVEVDSAGSLTRCDGTSILDFPPQSGENFERRVGG
mgnify:CR=1 FL=1